MIAFLLLLASSTSALRLAPSVGTPEFKWLREAEKKHARVALVAAPSLALLAMATGDDPVPWLNHQPISTQLAFYSAAGVLESLNLRRLDKGFKLKEGEEPGRLLPIRSELASLNLVEDVAGRACMLGVAATLCASAAGT